MRFSHNFGSFHPSVLVDGATFTFEDYKVLAKADREALREAAVKRCVDANVRVSEAGRVIQTAIRAEYKPKIEALIKPSRRASYQEKADYKHQLGCLVDAQQRELVKVWETPGLSIEGNTYPAAVHDIFTVWESKVETDREKLDRLLSGFDWYYSYSDDFRVWSAGERILGELRALVSKLGAEGQAAFDAAKPKV